MIICADSEYFVHGITGEAWMLPGVIEWLKATRSIQMDSVIARELPINGRRVDLATLTMSGLLCSFELKIGGFSRVLEQATYNRMSFDQSWIVVQGIPRDENIQSAEDFGVGIIAFAGLTPKMILEPASPRTDDSFRKRIIIKMTRIGELRNVRSI